MANKIPIKKVAEVAGVSTMTVSRVINNKKNVADETRNKVKKTISELGYQPNVIAQSLAKNKTNILAAVIYEENDNSFFFDMIMGIEEEASKNGYDLLIISRKEGVNCSDKLMNNGLVAGAILLGHEINKKDVYVLNKNNFPNVIIGRRNYDDIEPCFVATDYVNGIKRAVEYLLKKGHRKIGYIGGSLDFEPDYDKFLGYQQGLLLNNQLYKPTLVSHDNITQKDGYKSTKKILEMEPTAIIANDTNNALGTISAIKDSKLHIPGDISFIGCNSNPDLHKQFNELINLKISYLQIQKSKLGHIATRLLLAKLNGKKIDKKENLVPMNFIPTESISCI